MAIRPLLAAKMHAKVGGHWPNLFGDALSPEHKTLRDLNIQEGKRAEQLID